MKIDLGNVTREFDHAVFTKARELRKKTAERYAASYQLSKVDRYEIRHGLLHTVLERRPFGDTETVLGFNVFVTRKVCAELLQGFTTDLVEMVGLYASVVELGAREFIDPKDTVHIYKHLGAAKHAGFFFTPPSVALRMVQASMASNPEARTVLDPAAGVGVFLAYSVLMNDTPQKLIGVELDPLTAKLAEALLRSVRAAVQREVEIEIICMDFFEYLDSRRKSAVDSILMNPPYGSIKFLTSDLTDASTKAGLSEKKRMQLGAQMRQSTLDRASRLRRRFASYGMAKGTLEYSKLFVAAALDLLSERGSVVAITPSSWLGDDSSAAFRRSIIKNGNLHAVWMIPEAACPFQGVNQPTAVSVLGKRPSTRIEVSNPVFRIEEAGSCKVSLSLRSVMAVSGEQFKLPKCDERAIQLLVKLQGLGKLKDIKELTNARGELDLSAFKAYVSKADTGHRLIRGDHIRGWELSDVSISDKEGYVDYEGFVHAIGSRRKAKYIALSRIAIPQCSYLQKKKRIEAAIVPEQCVVANSCNFIALERSAQRDEKEFYYWVFLNSSLAEWQFRIFSYNNHVANRELDELLCPPHDSLSEKNLRLLRWLMGLKSPERYFYFDAFIGVASGLEREEYKTILQSTEASHMEQRLRAYDALLDLGRSEVANHQMPSLSELDKLMISYVEPGGNWTSIPESVPSKRLEQIRAMARTRGMVRTTYYSRLKYTQPAYTISTYFNRPGNGANIHPWEDRTLSCREAARLQSFPDSFLFLGNEAAIRTQIGNAVPPLLGYAIGQSIASAVGQPVKFCDVFAGAGGLSYGMELAGFKGIAAMELNRDAARTYAANHGPAVKMVVGDINDNQAQELFSAAVEGSVSPNEPWVMVGGPPCQGFSTAGYRNENDSRSKLVESYLSLIKKLHPPIVVMENVPGMLSMKGGRVIEGVYSSLHELGYHLPTSPWILDAERYGVPQMRRRVILIAVKEEKYLPSPPAPRFQKCLGRREADAGQAACSKQRYPVTVGEAFLGLPSLMPVNPYFPKDAVIDTSYSRWCKGELSTEAFLALRSSV